MPPISNLVSVLNYFRVRIRRRLRVDPLLRAAHGPCRSLAESTELHWHGRCVALAEASRGSDRCRGMLIACGVSLRGAAVTGTQSSAIDWPAWAAADVGSRTGGYVVARAMSPATGEGHDDRPAVVLVVRVLDYGRPKWLQLRG